MIRFLCCIPTSAALVLVALGTAAHPKEGFKPPKGRTDFEALRRDFANEREAD